MRDKVKYFLNNFYDISMFVYIKYRTRWVATNKLCRGISKIDSEYAKECTLFWGRYKKLSSTAWHNLYSQRNGVKSPLYIPEDVFYSEIEPFFNNMKFSGAYADKSLYSVWFNDADLPVTLIKNVAGVYYDDSFNVLTKAQALKKLDFEEKIIIKASIESGGGKNISVVERDKGGSANEVADLLCEFGENFVVQRFICQHPVLESLNPTSVNTIRLMTLFLDGEVYILSSHLRIGVDGAFYDHGGIVCGVSEEGVLSEVAYKYKVCDLVEKHPQGYPFAGIQIPSYEEMKKQAITQHKKFAHFKLISWDFAVDNASIPILIEYNLRWQGLNHHQLTSGPLFGDLTTRVLQEVYG